MHKLDISTDKLLKYARAYCDKNDKSTEFTLQFLQDVAGISLDEAIEFLTK